MYLFVWLAESGQDETKEVLSRSIMKVVASERTHDGRVWREAALGAHGVCLRRKWGVYMIFRMQAQSKES